ncbi:Signal peptidase I [Desulfovibrio sp. DV]|nr:Signal peptidase I [Desulfovibrio sp. DV]
MRRLPFGLTAFLTITVPGLGHIYNGQAKKGILLYLACAAIYYSQIYLKLIYTKQGLFICFLSNIVLYLYTLIDASILSLKTRDSSRLWYTKWYILILIITASMATSVYIDHLSFIPKSYHLSSNSMRDTLIIDDTTLVDLTAYETNGPEYDDIIVFTLPEDENKDFIKRVIGKPGDTVCIENKQVFVNGRKRDEEYSIHTDAKSRKRRDTMPPMTIPPGAYFVLGDNRDESYDSRFFGPIAKEKILGKARIIIWSDTWSRIGKTL